MLPVEKNREKCGDDAGWEATIPFVPFQSEIAYNVEIKRSRTRSDRDGTSGASEVSRGVRAGTGRRDIPDGRWARDMEISSNRWPSSL